MIHDLRGPRKKRGARLLPDQALDGHVAICSLPAILVRLLIIIWLVLQYHGVLLRLEQVLAHFDLESRLVVHQGKSVANARRIGLVHIIIIDLDRVWLLEGVEIGRLVLVLDLVEELESQVVDPVLVLDELGVEHFHQALADVLVILDLLVVEIELQLVLELARCKRLVN